MISGYIFVHIKEETFVPVLTTPGVVTFLKEKGKAVAIPAEQIERLRFVENQADEPLDSIRYSLKIFFSQYTIQKNMIYLFVIVFRMG